MSGFLIRDIGPADLDDFQKAAVHLDSVNLPDDRDALAQIIDRSRRSFAAVASGASEPPAKDRCLVFVAEERDSGAVVGTSMIFPQHGSRKAPHVYFDVLEEERYSETLDRHFAHRVLRIGYNYKGLTEVGGLVVRPEFRRHPERLGRLLMSIRFLYIARHRAAFRDEVLSELMPPLEADGTSLLWESLGRKFTGLTYQEADRLSQDNKEFIRALFPQDPLYASLLPAHVQERIGQVGPDTKAVEKVLRELGFSYAHRIDPFDGGPHFQARTDDITLVRATRTARVAATELVPGAAAVPAIVARERAETPYFTAVRTAVPVEEPPVDEATVTLALAADARDALQVAPGDENRVPSSLLAMPSTVFIVDDEKNIRRTVRMVLEGEGYAVEEASSGEEALARIAEMGADVVLLDVQLPGMSGLETIERIAKLKNLESAPTIIMISGHATLADAVRATKAGAYDLMEKPLDRERLMVALRNAVERRAMEREVQGLRAMTDERFEMVGRSAPMGALFAQIAKVAPTRTRILITGESGTGKELIARAIHRSSLLADKPFVKVNCAAIPPELIESELFGHERGAFTGATARKRGLFELADGGTIFLDEVGDMIASAQAKVLRVLQSGEFTRVGGEQALKVDVRVVAATNRDLQAAVASGGFREDLFFRLNVVPLRAPPLRDRPEDVPLLSRSFVELASRENGMKVKPISDEALTMLAGYPWPGNVRELRNVIERLVILSEESIDVGDLPEEIVAEVARSQREASAAASELPRVELPAEARALPLREFRDHMEREYIRIKLDENGWNISRTATLLGIERTNLHKKMRALGLSRDSQGHGSGPGQTPS